jgi:hypothetical protein
MLPTVIALSLAVAALLVPSRRSAPCCRGADAVASTIIIPMATPPGSTAPDGVVTNDGWLPDIDLASLRASYRIRDVVTPDRLETAVIGAMLAVRADLRDWIAARRAEGAVSLGQVSADIIQGRSVLALAYGRAVGAYTRAELS